MSSLLVVKSHFPQFVHLNQEMGKLTAVTSSGHWGPGERGEVAAVNCGSAGMALGSYIGGAAVVNRGGRAIHRKRGGCSSYLFTTLKHKL